MPPRAMNGPTETAHSRRSCIAIVESAVSLGNRRLEIAEAPDIAFVAHEGAGRHLARCIRRRKSARLLDVMPRRAIALSRCTARTASSDRPPIEGADGGRETAAKRLWCHRDAHLLKPFTGVRACRATLPSPPSSSVAGCMAAGCAASGRRSRRASTSGASRITVLRSCCTSRSTNRRRSALRAEWGVQSLACGKRCPGCPPHARERARLLPDSDSIGEAKWIRSHPMACSSRPRIRASLRRHEPDILLR